MDEGSAQGGTGFSDGLSGAKQAVDAYGEDLEAAMAELTDDAAAGEEPEAMDDASTGSMSAAASDDASCRCHDRPPQDAQFEYVKDGALPNLFEVIIPGVNKFLEDYGEDLGAAIDMLEAEDAAAEVGDEGGAASDADQQA